MSRFSLLATALFLLTPLAFAAPPPHDFGTHSTGPVLEHVFLVPNETGVPFEAGSREPACLPRVPLLPAGHTVRANSPPPRRPPPAPGTADLLIGAVLSRQRSAT